MSAEAPTLLIRADASLSIGTGHVMRMIALAQAWRARGGRAVFFSAEITPTLEKRLRNERFPLERVAARAGSSGDCDAICAAVAEFRGSRPPAVVLDGYRFGAEFQFVLKKTGCRLLYVDDGAASGSYHADVVLDPNIAANERLYCRRDEGTRLLLGPRFALIRQEFLKYQEWRRTIPDKAAKLLVTLGGADADNVTVKIIDALQGLRLEVKVVVGGSNPHLQSLRRVAQIAARAHNRVEIVVDPPDMPELMVWADLAVSAAGSTSWELALTGLPPLFIIVSENQRQNAYELEKHGFGLCLGEHSCFDKISFRQLLDRLMADRSLRAGFCSQGKSIVDGFGAARVAEVLFCHERLELLPVAEADLSLLWEWANDPETRSNSFDSTPISWDGHLIWCQAKLKDPLCSFWIASMKGLGKIGCVRFDQESKEAVISVALSPKARGRGLGSELIAAACDRFFRTSGVLVIKALIKPNNSASIGAFQRAGFRRAGCEEVKGTPAELYALNRLE